MITSECCLSCLNGLGDLCVKSGGMFKWRLIFINCQFCSKYFYRIKLCEFGDFDDKHSDKDKLSWLRLWEWICSSE